MVDFSLSSSQLDYFYGVTAPFLSPPIMLRAKAKATADLAQTKKANSDFWIKLASLALGLSLANGASEEQEEFYSSLREYSDTANGRWNAIEDFKEAFPELEADDSEGESESDEDSAPKKEESLESRWWNEPCKPIRIEKEMYNQLWKLAKDQGLDHVRKLVERLLEQAVKRDEAGLNPVTGEKESL